MTVQNTGNRKTYTGDGSSTVFSYNYKFLQATDLKVYANGTLMSLTTDYTVGIPTDSGAVVTFNVAPAVGVPIVIIGDPDRLQQSSLPSTGPFPAKTVETMADKLTLIVQRLYDLASRSLTLNDSDTVTGSTSLPSFKSNNMLGWGPDAGSGLQNIDPVSLATIVAFGTANADIFTGTGAQIVFTLSANPGAQANLDISVGGVTQYPGLDYNWSGGTTLTFLVAPPNGAKILARYFQGLPQGATDSAASIFIQSGTGAVTRNARDKLRESVSVLDFGAVGDDVTDDTTAFQVAISAARVLGRALYVPTPPVAYKITAQINFNYDASNARGLLIHGDSSGDYTGIGGSVIHYTGTTGFCFSVNGRGSGVGGVNSGSPMGYRFQGLTFQGNASCSGAINIERAWFNDVLNCQFHGFSNTAGGTITLNASGTGNPFAGDAVIEGNHFHSCGRSVVLTGATGGQVNVVQILCNKFLDGYRHVVSDWPGVPFTNNVTVVANSFQNPSDHVVYSSGVAQNWVIEDNYLEINGTLFTNRWIEFLGATNLGISVKKNSFIGTLNAAAQAHVFVTNGRGIDVSQNQADNGGLTDRYSVHLAACTDAIGQAAVPVGGGAPYLVRMNGVNIASGKVNDQWLQSLPTGANKFNGIATGDGWPGGSVNTLNTSQYGRTNGRVTVDVDCVLTTKSGSGSSVQIGLFPYNNAGGTITFGAFTTGITGTQPFHFKMSGGTNFATLYDATDTAVNSSAMSVGATVKCSFSYPTQD